MTKTTSPKELSKITKEEEMIPVQLRLICPKCKKELAYNFSTGTAGYFKHQCGKCSFEVVTNYRYPAFGYKPKR